MTFKNVQEVAEWRLCSGCGACAFACRKGNVNLYNFLEDGIRPIVDNSQCASCGDCLKVCPGYEASHSTPQTVKSIDADLFKDWGPVIEFWEGYAKDEQMRRSGSSGGVISAMALYCMEQEGMAGTLHTGQNQIKPLQNDTFLSSDRGDLLSRTGSRYSPASPCEALNLIEDASDPCLFVGKPCDVLAVKKARSISSQLDQNIGLSMGIFCAGTPSSKGLLDLLETEGINPETVSQVIFRGAGWPGKFRIVFRDIKRPDLLLSYKESWGFLEKYRPLRCIQCPDGTGEFADLSCGDAWYRDPVDNQPGFSLILVRTEKGREILRKAADSGYIAIQPCNRKQLEDSQPGLFQKRRAIWGRVNTMRLFLIPAPKYRGFQLFDGWLKLPFTEKARSTFGTVKRLIIRKHYRRLRLQNLNRMSDTDQHGFAKTNIRHESPKGI